MSQIYLKKSRSGSKVVLSAILILTTLFGVVYFNKVSAAAGIPKILSHQGRLLDSSGNLLGGSGTNYCYLFSIYNAASGGSKLWPSGNSATTTVSVKNGIYNVDIGDTSAGGDPLTLSFNDDAYYLNIQIANSSGGSCATVLLSSYETLTPRKHITSAGYAINSGTVGGFTASQTPGLNQIPVLDSSGYLNLSATSPQINSTGSNTLTLQGAGGSLGNIQFFNSSNYITPTGILNSLGLITTNATTTNLEVTATTTFNGQRMRFPSTAGSSGQVLSTNGSGVLSWVANGGGSQTPWSQNIDGNGHDLTGVNKIVSTFASSTVFSVNNTLYVGSLDGPLQANNGVVSATTSVGVIYGGTGSTTLSGLLKGNGTNMIATALAGTDYVIPSVSTLSSLSITNSQVSDFSTGVNSYIHASTTIPKTYSTNVFTGSNTFNSTITGSVSGNAGTVTNGVYTTGAGTVYLTPTGSAASLTNFPTLNQNTTGSAASVTAASQPNITSLGTLTALTVNSSTATFSQDTNFVLSGGVNGLSFDTSTFSVDAINHRIGIGTTSPTSLLTVWGNSTTVGRSLEVVDSASTTLFSVDNAGTTTITSLNVGSAEFAADAGQVQWITMPLASTTMALNTQFGFSAGIGATSTLTVFALANGAGGSYGDAVGIGSTTPSAKFAVTGNSTNDTGRLFAFADYANNERLSLLNNGLLTLAGSLTVDTNLVVADATNNKVGIGTTTPTSLLQLSGATPKLTLSDTGAGANLKHWFIESSGGSFNIGTTSDALATNASYRAFSINSSGNIGIGTSTPLQGLSINKRTVAINSTSDATLGVSQTTSSVLTARGLHVSVVANGYIYVIGGYNNAGTPLSSVEYAKVNSDGTLGSWMTTSSLNTARYGHTAVFVNGYIYAIAGVAGGTYSTSVEYAKVNSDGTLGSWMTTSSLNTARNSHTSVISNGYIYAISGVNNLGVSSVEYAKVNSDGTLGSWNYTTSVVNARNQHTSVVSNGYIYIIAGWNGSFLSSVEYAKVNSDGTLGSWMTASSNLNTARYGHTSVIVNGYVYVIAGTNTGNSGLSSVEYAKVNSDGTLGSWMTTSSIITARLNHSTSVINGFIYIISGMTTNTFASEITSVEYMSTARTQIAGVLDLVGLNGSTSTPITSFGGMGSAIYAGDIFSTNNLEVAGNTTLWSGLGVNGALTLKATTSRSQAIPVLSVMNATSTGALFNVLYNGQVTIPNGSFCVDSDGSCNASTTGRISALSYTTGSSDIAENYSSSEALEAGDIVTSLGGESVGKADRNSRAMIGVVSTKPGIVLGLDNDANQDGKFPIALAGRVPVKVNLEGGDIGIGDHIALSSVAGTGMKATTTSRVVGIALESFTSTSTTDRILMFIENKDHVPTSQLFIDSSGNVGINNTEPAYKLQVSGDIAANSFVNLSSREYKKDISYLSKDDESSILDQINKTFVARYSYIKDATSSPFRLGLIAEEAPKDVLSESGKGIDLYKLVSFLLAGMKAQQAQISALAIRVGGGVADGISAMRDLVAATFEVGSSDARTGITVHDLKTGDPYCMAVYDGNNISIPGKCKVYDGSTLIYQKDSVNNSNSTPAVNSVSDTEAPVIILNGNATSTLNVGDSYVDPGATVTDNVDHNLGVHVSGDLANTSMAGIYTVRYNATDSAGNKATEVTRTVTILGHDNSPLLNLDATTTNATSTPQ